MSTLDELVRAQPLAVLEHVHRIKQLLEYVLALPPSVATAMLTSLLPLQRQRPELRDHLVLLLRKAMFSREEPTRLTAVHGFLLLLHTTSAPSGADAAATATSDPTGGASAALRFQLELLGFIRRSLTQQAAIRRALYEGVVPAFVEQPHLRPMIFELLMGQLASYTDIYEDDDTSSAALRNMTPLRLDRCISFSGHDDTATAALIEPLPQLVNAITQCMLAQMADGADGDERAADGSAGDDDGGGGDGQCPDGSGSLVAVRRRMRMLIDRLGACNLKHFDLHSDDVLTVKDKKAPCHYATATFLAATLEALLDHTLLCHVGSTDCDGDGAAGAADGPIFMATQGDAGTMATQSHARAAPFGADDEGVRAARKLFAVGSSVRDVVGQCKAKGLKPLAPWLSFDLSLEACTRVLAALDSEATATSTQGSQQQKAATSKRFARHVLKGIAARTTAISASLSDGGMAGGGMAPAATTALNTAGRVLGLLLKLSPKCEQLVDKKECVSGMRNGYINHLTGVFEKSTEAEHPVKVGKGGKGAKGEAAASAEKMKIPSRLLLLLQALDSTVGLLAAHAPADVLSAALAPAVGLAGAGEETEAFGDETEVAHDSEMAEGPPQRRAFEDGSEGGAVLTTLTLTILPLVERLVANDSYVEADAALSVGSRLSALLPAASLGEPLEWSCAEACLDNTKVALQSTAKALLTYHLALSRRATPSHGADALLRLTKYIHAVSSPALEASPRS